MAQDTKKLDSTQTAIPTVTLMIDGRQITVPKGTTILNAARENGIEIPTFCWHPKLKSVGACRICYVEIEKWPKLQVSCATEASEGMVVYTASDNVKQGRKAVLEFILLNHPLDCPTCDKGGECDLQNLTFAHATDTSRYDFRKFRFREDEMETTFDDKKIGPEINLNRNRCILCYKCVRANKEAFGEYDIGNYERGNISEINSAPGREVANPFSGNLVEICPVGALTNSDWRYKVRVWLTETAPSVCNFGSSGSNINFTTEKHKNILRRVTSRMNDAVDDGWITDITRYGYQMVNSEDRLTQPMIKKDGVQVPATWEEALDVVVRKFGEIKDKKGSVCLGGLVGPSLDNKTLYSFSKFFRKNLRSNNIDYRSDYRMLPDCEDTVFNRLASQPFCIEDIDSSDVIVVIGSDLHREHHNEYLRIRKAYDSNSARCFTLNPYSVKASDITELDIVHLPGKEEHLLNAIGFAAILENLVDPAIATKFGSTVPGTLEDSAQKAGVDKESILTVAKALANGKKITIIVGEIIVRSREREAISAALANLNLLFSIQSRGQIASLARYANSKGAEKMGATPYPAKAITESMRSCWGEYPDCSANNTDAMLALMKKEEIGGFLVMGANPMMLYPDQEFAREGLEHVEFLVACEMFETETTQLADVVLPLCSWAEYAGEYTNLEGRVQSADKAIKPIGQSLPGYAIIEKLADRMGSKLFESDQEVTTEMEKLLSLDTSLPMPTEFCEVKTAEESSEAEFDLPIYICDDPHHSGYLTEKSPSLNAFVGEAYIEVSDELANKKQLADGDTVRVESPVGKVIVPVKISDHLENNVVLMPRNFSVTQTTSLLMRKRRVDYVKISKVDG